MCQNTLIYDCKKLSTNKLPPAPRIYLYKTKQTKIVLISFSWFKIGVISLDIIILGKIL